MTVKLLMTVLACALALTACAGSSLQNVPPPQTELLIDDLPKWRRVHNLESAHPTFTGSLAVTSNSRAAEDWAGLYRNYVNAPVWAQARAVNLFFNGWDYVEDTENWGVDDYWETPAEFMERAGDCEDYAIAKYYALKAMGVPVKNMCIAMVWNLKRAEGHAVLLVFTNGQYYMLDNFRDEVVPSQSVRHYKPFFYINDDAAWLHEKQR